MSPEPTEGVVLTPGSAVVSAAELLKNFIDEFADERVPAGAVVGGANDRQQQEGVVAIMDAGNTRNELYAPLLHKRCQLRCMAGSLYEANKMGQYLFQLLHDQKWLVMTDAEGAEWFVHGIHCTTGPSDHIDSGETWESLLFANITVGSDPVSTPGP